MPTSKERRRLSDASEEFLLHCRIGKRMSPHSLRAYRTDLADFSRFLGADLRVDGIEREALKGFLRYLSDARGLRATSIKRRFACLKVFFRWLENEGVIEITPFHRLEIRLKLPKRLPRGLSHGEIDALRNAAARPFLKRGGKRPDFSGCDRDPSRFDALTGLVIVELLYATGIRVAELCAVKSTDITLGETRGLRVLGKGDRERWIPLSDPAVARLLDVYIRTRSRWIERLAIPQDSLLISARALPHTTSVVRKRLAALARAARLERRVTPHMLRHTAATHLLQAGLDLRHTQRLLGHSSISTTEIYTAVSDRSLEEAMKRIDR